MGPPQTKEKNTPQVQVLDDRVIKKEFELYRAGKIEAVQEYRMQYFDIMDGDYSGRLLQAEDELLNNSQYEEALRKRLAGEENENTSGENGPLQDLQKKVSEAERQTWILKRRLWALRSAAPDTIFTRGITLWRSNPKWFMHRALCEDCAGKGGCCGRGCGCCAKRLANGVPAGHCTLECPCCESARGFELDETEKLELFNMFSAASGDEKWRRDGRFRLIMIQLIGYDNYKKGNPFKQIVDSLPKDDPPPRYESLSGALRDLDVS
ncbi:hypothetical protein N7456_008937 [Penicillium angulare]|uniref:Uncharacterized protein n=1 Tax=Penicillium angulare TaxID=116970 RepID=A0A9W9K593_9EURO|nr:hypothetical protein N7456_008937 [Penicillium angulare]